MIVIALCLKQYGEKMLPGRREVVVLHQVAGQIRVTGIMEIWVTYSWMQEDLT